MIPAKTRKLLAGLAAATVAFGFAHAQQGPRGKSSYMPVDIAEPFSVIFARLNGCSAATLKRLQSSAFRQA
jgi:hypothetical protein